VTVEEMAGGSGSVDVKETYTKRKRKKKITWNRNKNNKLKSEVAFIQSLKEAYNSVRFVVLEPNL
jgi:phage terminase small subunit